MFSKQKILIRSKHWRKKHFLSICAWFQILGYVLIHSLGKTGQFSKFSEIKYITCSKSAIKLLKFLCWFFWNFLKWLEFTVLTISGKFLDKEVVCFLIFTLPAKVSKVFFKWFCNRQRLLGKVPATIKDNRKHHRWVNLSRVAWN